MRASASARPSAGATRRIARLVWVNALVLVLLVAGVELGARVFFPRTLETMFSSPEMLKPGHAFVIPHAERGFCLQPGFEGSECRVNSAGFRGEELPDGWSQGSLLVAVGESSTFGWGVRETESYPAILQQRLNHDASERSLLVLNAGVPSYTSPQVLVYLKEILARCKPIGVIASVLWNDVLYSYVEPWMPDYLIHQQPARWRQVLLRRSGLYRALVLDDSEAVRHADGENPAARAYYARNLEQIVTECSKRQVPLVFFVPSVNENFLPETGIPIGRQVVSKASFMRRLEEYAGEVEAIAGRHGVPVARLRVDVSETKNAYFIDPVHLNVAGNRLLAEDVEASLVAAGIVP